jgi:hypothetical protein
MFQTTNQFLDMIIPGFHVQFKQCDECQPLFVISWSYMRKITLRYLTISTENIIEHGDLPIQHDEFQ